VSVLEYDLTADDFIAFNLCHMTSANARRHLRNFRVNMSVAIPLVAFAFSALAVQPSWIVFLSMALAGGILWFLSPLIWNDAVRRNLRRMARDTGLGAAGRHRLELNDDGLREESPNGVMSTPWRSILRVDETSEHAFVFFGPTQAFVIPKRIGEAEVSGFVAQVRRRVESAPVPT